MASSARSSAPSLGSLRALVSSAGRDRGTAGRVSQQTPDPGLLLAGHGQQLLRARLEHVAVEPTEQTVHEVDPVLGLRVEQGLGDPAPQVFAEDGGLLSLGDRTGDGAQPV